MQNKPRRSPSLIRKNEVLLRVGIKKSALYKKIHQGVFVPPIPIGSRAVAWVNDEVDCITTAMVAGKSDNELRAIVNELITRRNIIFQDMDIIKERVRS